jgi:hypothetical protein
VVKLFIAFFILFSSLIAEENALTTKIRSLVEIKDYKEHKGFINILFKNENKFITNNQLNIIKIIKTLQSNGLFKFIFNKPENIKITFKTNEMNNLLLSIKSIKDSLNDIGYNFFTTIETTYNGYLKWSINIKTNVSIDPILLNNEFAKRGIVITDVIKHSKTQWTYELNTDNPRLSDVFKIQKNTSMKIKKYSDIFIQPDPKLKGEHTIQVISHPHNTWHPYVVFYDKQLNILKIRKHNKIIKNITFNIPIDSYYIKISDIYVSKNFNNGFRVLIK